MDLHEVRTDSQMEEQGTWVPYDSQTSFLLASTYSRRYRKSQRKVIKPYANVIRREGVDALGDEEAETLTINVLADSVVLGWKGLMDAGQEIPYSKETCRKLLLDFPRLREWVSEKSQASATFRPNGVDEKNLEPVSAGITGGTGVTIPTA